MTDRLRALSQFLGGLPDRPSVEYLTDGLTRHEIDCADVASCLRFSDRTYQRNLLRAGPAYQAWVLCWKNGQRSPIHDHTGSSCAVRVLRGTLTETLFAFAPIGHVKAVGSRDCGPGSVLGSADADLHQVSNLQGG